MSSNLARSSARGRTIRRSRDGFEYAMQESSWVVSNGRKFYFSNHFQLDHLDEYKEVLSNFLETHSPSYCENIHSFVREYIKGTGARTFNSKDISLFRADLGAEGEHRLGHIKAFLLQWSDWGYSGVSDSLADWLQEQKIRGNVKGRAVRTQCPYSGAFSRVERASILEWASDEFRDGALPPDTYAALYLVATTGQRPVQYAGLKSKDLKVKVDRAAQGEHENYLLKLPKAKQRNAGFRSGLVHMPINDAIYLVAAHLRDLNLQKLNSMLDPGQ
ncbi:MAG: hypothetical protein KME58_04720 [Candidatus Thiodiazotropha sp. (ex Lucina pensylvanica)]|nr:hypothetical protein [Candidatus Thiodiazotropha sp. (ex Lucina pensylvanica)]